MSDRRRVRKNNPWNSLVAAAELMLAPNKSLRGHISKPEAWQSDAWNYYDSVGELRFGISWISNAMSRVNLVAAAPATSPGDEPTIITPQDEGWTSAQLRAAEIVQTICGGPGNQSQMLGAFGVHLSLTGICWLVAEPSFDDFESDFFESWELYSSEQIRTANGVIEIEIAPRTWRELHPNAIVVKVWRKHPRKTWEADAPVHGVLGVLREIDLLQKHIHASAQSRLAGAGLLAIPSEAVFPPGQGPQSSIEDIDNENQNTRATDDTFVETLIDAMTTPIADRGSAAAVVPLVVKIPGEYVDKVKHISFATPFDSQVLSLMDSAITRLSLGLDIPPEVLTGKGSTNHWSAWQVQEESITLHIEPLSETICNALTIGFLRPALEAEGFDPDEAVVWYDTSDLRTRPDKSNGAIAAYDRNELSAEALLRELGLSMDDLPSEEEKREKILLSVARGAPTLAPVMLSELGYLSASVADEAIADESDSPQPIDAESRDGSSEEMNTETDRRLPNTSPNEINASLLAACDIIIVRALEKAGTRLKSAAGKNIAGGAASIPCENPIVLHTQLNALHYSTPDKLLDKAWNLVPTVAERHAVDPDQLTKKLHDYTVGLIIDGLEHSYDGLRQILSV